MKRTLGSLALILLPFVFAGFVWFAINDRAAFVRRDDTIERKADEAKQLATEALRLQAVQAAQAEARWEEVKSSLDRIERDVRDMKARTN